VNCCQPLQENPTLHRNIRAYSCQRDAGWITLQLPLGQVPACPLTWCTGERNNATPVHAFWAQQLRRRPPLLVLSEHILFWLGLIYRSDHRDSASAAVAQRRKRPTENKRLLTTDLAGGLEQVTKAGGVLDLYQIIPMYKYRRMPVSQ